MIRILLCDDQPVVTMGMSTILGSAADLEVVGVASDGVEALQKTETSRPDIVLMDLKMPLINGVEATRKIRETHPDVKILVLTTYDQDEWIFDAIRAGAAGYLLKDTPPTDLIKAIRDTMEGKSHVDPAIAGRLLERVAAGEIPAPTGVQYDLTERELDVLGLLAEGYANKQIALQLHLSPGTVRNLVSSILLKLNLSDRTRAAVFALKHGLGGRRR